MNWEGKNAGGDRGTFQNKLVNLTQDEAIGPLQSAYDTLEISHYTNDSLSIDALEAKVMTKGNFMIRLNAIKTKDSKWSLKPRSDRTRQQ